MPLTFDKIPSEIEIPISVKQPLPTVEQELDSCKCYLWERKTKCRNIEPLYTKPKRKPPSYYSKFYCVCPKYRPKYNWKHTGNIIIDRDVLTKEEHICYLSQPTEDKAAPRKMPRCYYKKVRMPECTSRVATLALPTEKHMKYTLKEYRHVLPKRKFNRLKNRLRDQVPYTDVVTALNYISEENRLKKIARKLEKQSCKRIKKAIISNQRKQIKKIICVLFEEMKDFLLNDQFLIDERSTLCSVILEQIREFTDKEFYTTSNLREYQHILANNLAVWINKFISNLNIHITPPKPAGDAAELESYLPIKDYISCSDSYAEEIICEERTSIFSENDGTSRRNVGATSYTSTSAVIKTGGTATSNVTSGTTLDARSGAVTPTPADETDGGITPTPVDTVNTDAETTPNTNVGADNTTDTNPDATNN